MKSHFETVLSSLHRALNNEGEDFDYHVLKLRPTMVELVDKYSSEVELGEASILARKSQCHPWNNADFLERLHTFQNPSVWFAKPAIISPPECALHGWCNNGSDRLHCFSCNVDLFHEKDDESGVLLHSQLTSAHSEVCGWRHNCCERTFLNIQQINPKETNNELLSTLVKDLQSLLIVQQGDAEPQTKRVNVRLSIDNDEKMSALLNNFEFLKTFGSSVSLPLPNSALIITELITFVKSLQPQHNESFDISNREQYGNLIQSLISRVKISGNDIETTQLARLLEMLILLRIFGWEIIETKKQLSVHCAWCNRTVSLSPYMTAATACEEVCSVGSDDKCFDFVSQHKTYCTYVNVQYEERSDQCSVQTNNQTGVNVSTDDASNGVTLNNNKFSNGNRNQDESIPQYGWELGLYAVTQVANYPLRTKGKLRARNIANTFPTVTTKKSASTGDNLTVQNKDDTAVDTISSPLPQSSAASGIKRSVQEVLTETLESAEQVYKKIKLVLNKAT